MEPTTPPSPARGITRVHVAIASGPLCLAIMRALGDIAVRVTPEEAGSPCDALIVHARGEPDALDRVDCTALEGRPLVVVVDGGPGALDAALRIEAAGYIDADDSHLVPLALGHLACGLAFFSPRVARRVRLRLGGEPAVDDPCLALTPREREVGACFVAGLTYTEAADALGISINTVRQHVRRIYEKLGVGSKSAAVVALLRLLSTR